MALQICGMAAKWRANVGWDVAPKHQNSLEGDINGKMLGSDSWRLGRCNIPADISRTKPYSKALQRHTALALTVKPLKKPHDKMWAVF